MTYKPMCPVCGRSVAVRQTKRSGNPFVRHANRRGGVECPASGVDFIQAGRWEKKLKAELAELAELEGAE